MAARLLFSISVYSDNATRDILMKNNETINGNLVTKIKNMLAAIFIPKEKHLRQLVERHNSAEKPIGYKCFSDLSEKYFSEPINTIISGGTQDTRFVVEQFCLEQALTIHKMPVVVVHCGNNCFSSRYRDSAMLPGGTRGTYSPLNEMRPMEIATIITEVGRKCIDLPNLLAFWSFLFDLIAEGGQNITLNNLINFPWHNDIDIVGYLNERGVATVRQAPIALRYRAVSGMVGDARLLLSKLSQCMPAANNLPQYSLKEIVNGKGLAVIDLLSNTNTVYKELCFAEIDMLVRSGAKFLLVLEGVSLVGKGSVVDEVLLRTGDLMPLIYAADDIFTMATGREDFFHVLTGKNANAVVLRHISASNAKQWEEYLGAYYHKKIEIGGSKTRHTMQVFNDSSTESFSISEERRSIVTSNEIVQLQESEAFIKTVADGRLSRVILR
jgi:hypothetical protein